MNIREINQLDLDVFYGGELAMNNVAGIAAEYDGIVKGVIGIVGFNDEGTPLLAFSDSDGEMSKKDLIKFGKAGVEFIHGAGLHVYAVCSKLSSKVVGKMGGFKEVGPLDDKVIMEWEPAYDFSQMLPVPISSTLPGLSLRQKVEIIEWVLLHSFDNIVGTFPIEEALCDGVYCRRMFIPAGSMLTGKIHLKEHFCVLERGDISVMTDSGVKRIKAPYEFVASANTKKVGYAHEDCIFTTYHETELTDFKEIENELTDFSDLSWIDNLMERIE